MLVHVALQHAPVLGQCRRELLDDYARARSGHGALLCACKVAALVGLQCAILDV